MFNPLLAPALQPIGATTAVADALVRHFTPLDSATGTHFRLTAPLELVGDFTIDMAVVLPVKPKTVYLFGNASNFFSRFGVFASGGGSIRSKTNNDTAYFPNGTLDAHWGKRVIIGLSKTGGTLTLHINGAHIKDFTIDPTESWIIDALGANENAVRPPAYYQYFTVRHQGDTLVHFTFSESYTPITNWIANEASTLPVDNLLNTLAWRTATPENGTVTRTGNDITVTADYTVGRHTPGHHSDRLDASQRYLLTLYCSGNGSVACWNNDWRGTGLIRIPPHIPIQLVLPAGTTRIRLQNAQDGTVVTYHGVTLTHLPDARPHAHIVMPVSGDSKVFVLDTHAKHWISGNLLTHTPDTTLGDDAPLELTPALITLAHSLTYQIGVTIAAFTGSGDGGFMLDNDTPVAQRYNGQAGDNIRATLALENTKNLQLYGRDNAQVRYQDGYVHELIRFD